MDALRKCLRALLAGALCLGMLFATAPPALAADQSGRVLRPHARPYGYSLDDMAQLMALFDSSGNSMTQYYPYPAPFQILFAPAAVQTLSSTTCSDGAAGMLVSGSQSFSVTAGSAFFVPVFSYDDSPPLVGSWPTDKSQFASYIFGPSGFNTSGAQISVDGRVSVLGAEFLGGPATQTTPALLDGGGTHLVQLGVFLAPMSVGTHTVTIEAEVGDSAPFIQVYAGYPGALGDCLKEAFTYTVRVLPPLEAD